MGGRGASSGIGDNGHKYGTEYRTVLQVGNFKFIKQNDLRDLKPGRKYKPESVRAPMETMTPGRTYVVVDNDNEIKYIVHNVNYKRAIQIDVKGTPHIINGKPVIPHVHYGYEHSEFGTEELDARQRKMVARVKRYWYNHRDGK